MSTRAINHLAVITCNPATTPALTLVPLSRTVRRYQSSSLASAHVDVAGFGVKELNKFSTEVAALLRSKSGRASGSVAARKSGPQPTLWANSVDSVDLRRSLYEYEYEYAYEYSDYESNGTPPPLPGPSDDVTPTPDTTPETDPEPTPDATTALPSEVDPEPTPNATPSPSEGTEPTPSPTDATGTEPTPSPTVMTGTVYDGYIGSADIVLQTSQGTSSISTTDKAGKFDFAMPAEASGFHDLVAKSGGRDSFTGRVFPYSLALPFAEQVSGSEVTISPFTTLAYFTRYGMASPTTSLPALMSRVADSLELTLPEGMQLAAFDAIKNVARNAAPGAPGRLAAIRSMLASNNIMSVVSTTASLYGSVCRVPRATSGDWAFKAVADNGPAVGAKLMLTDVEAVADIIGSDWLIDLCLSAIDANQAARKRSLLQGTREEITAQLKSHAGTVAKATAELNQRMETAAASDSASSEELITLIATYSYVSQGKLSEEVEHLGAGDITPEVFVDTVTGTKLAAAIALVELPEDAISAINGVIRVNLAGEPVPTETPIDLPVVASEPRKYSAAEIVGISIGPLIGVAAISVTVFLVLILMKRRASRKVTNFNNEDTETGLIDNEEGRPTADAASPAPGADESTYYTMPAPQPPRSPVRFPSKKDPLAPAAPRTSNTDQQEMDIVSQAKKMEQERARQDFESILKAQQDYISKASASASSGTAPPAPPAMPAQEEEPTPPPPPPPPPAVVDDTQDEQPPAPQ